jgi:hypothetical protein
MKTYNKIAGSILIYILLLVPASKVQAQGGFCFNKSEAEEAQKRKAIFIIKNTDHLMGKKKELAESFNETLESVVKNSWTFNKEYEFKTLEEVHALKDSKTKDYAIFFFKDYGTKDLELMPCINNPTSAVRHTIVNPPIHFTFTNVKDEDRCVLCFDLIEDFTPDHSDRTAFRRFFNNITLPHIHPTASDIHSSLFLAQAILCNALKDMKNSALASQKKRRLEALKNLTLLVPKDLIEVDADFKANYPYKYQIVNAIELSEYLNKKDSNYAYLELFPYYLFYYTQSTTNNIRTTGSSSLWYYYYYIFNAGTGENLVNSKQKEEPFYGTKIVAPTTGITFQNRTIPDCKLNNKRIKNLAKE